MEIEKKYLIRNMPENLEHYAKREIEQGYLNRKPVLRIRRSDDSYILTYKAKPDAASDTSDAICNIEIENWIMHFKLKRIDMVESLKSVE